jgi:hypothetical protein
MEDAARGGSVGVIKELHVAAMVQINVVALM